MVNTSCVESLDFLVSKLEACKHSGLSHGPLEQLMTARSWQDILGGIGNVKRRWDSKLHFAENNKNRRSIRRTHSGGSKSPLMSPLLPKEEADPALDPISLSPSTDSIYSSQIHAELDRNLLQSPARSSQRDNADAGFSGEYKLLAHEEPVVNIIPEEKKPQPVGSNLHITETKPLRSVSPIGWRKSSIQGLPNVFPRHL
jgi:hypothetical protein